MQHGVGHGMELELLDDGHVLGTVDVKIHHVDVRGVDHLAKVAGGNGKGKGLGKTVLTTALTVEVAGHHAGFAKLTGGFLAHLGSLAAVQIDFFHNGCVTLN